MVMLIGGKEDGRGKALRGFVVLRERFSMSGGNPTKRYCKYLTIHEGSGFGKMALSVGFVRAIRISSVMLISMEHEYV